MTYIQISTSFLTLPNPYLIIERLYPLIQELNQTIADYLNEGETVFLVDSIPIPVCQIAREKQSKICKESFETAPDKGFSTVSKSYYYGYKLHPVRILSRITAVTLLQFINLKNDKPLNHLKYALAN
jgi:penicillin-binding protein-related factor A (putative recombinase)